MGPYDFSKYEMMSTSHQIQDLLSKKLDTPKGSSGSENEQGEMPEHAPGQKGHIYSQVVQAHNNARRNTKDEHAFMGTSPEPTRKQTLTHRLRTERKALNTQ